MAVKLRLQRHGKKGKPFFHIVAADSRSPRDGKFIERIGSYNPNTNPASIQLDNERAVVWIKNGAQPTDTVRAMLSYTGVLFRLHLDKGVAKGALTQDEADKRYEAWVQEKASKIQGKKDALAKGKSADETKRLKHEREVNENRLKAITAAAEAASSVHAEVSEPASEATSAEETTPSESTES
jgi:small subunit ribosomal protein S16